MGGFLLGGGCLVTLRILRILNVFCGFWGRCSIPLYQLVDKSHYVRDFTGTEPLC